MSRIRTIRRLTLLWVLVLAVVILGAQAPSKAKENNTTTIHVVVTDAESGKPISQARLTLQFHQILRTMGVKRSKLISFSAKTNPQGHCRFTEISKGTIRLLVTAEDHMSFGKDIEINKDNQEIEVKLKKPQPQL